MARRTRPVRRIEDRLARRGGVVELLRLPAALFGLVARARGRLYDLGWLPVTAVATPVISVGNLTAGGTGKTPFVVWLVGRLEARGLRPGLLSRGYRPAGERAAKGTPNDEARLLAALLPGVPHIEDRDRVRGAAALEAQGVDVIVLDDGFQHRRLARDLDLVLVDATRPFGLAAPPEATLGGRGAGPVRALLPRGLMREPAHALARAHALVLTRTDAVAPAALTALEAELARLAPRAPIARAVHRPTRLTVLASASEARVGATLTLDWLRGRTVDLVSGIGNPAAFERTVQDVGGTVGEHLAFPDHHTFSGADLARLGARPVILTAKDAARVGAPSPAFSASLPPGLEVLALGVALEVTSGAASLDALLDHLPPSPARLARAASHAGLHG